MHLTGTVPSNNTIHPVSLRNISGKDYISGISYLYHKSLFVSSKTKHQSKLEIKHFCLLAERIIKLEKRVRKNTTIIRFLKKIR